jgi:hypothetical protein
MVWMATCIHPTDLAKSDERARISFNKAHNKVPLTAASILERERKSVLGQKVAFTKARKKQEEQCHLLQVYQK